MIALCSKNCARQSHCSSPIKGSPSASVDIETCLPVSAITGDGIERIALGDFAAAGARRVWHSRKTAASPVFGT